MPEPEKPPRPQSPRGEAVTVEASDGYRLAGELFVEGAPRGAVVIASAMGVKRRLYAHFARHLSSEGIAALTLDYRGVGDSAPSKLRGFEAHFHDWGELDLRGAVDFLSARFPGLPLGWVGHSAGGQVFGLLESSPVRAVLCIGSQSGYWRNWTGTWKAGMWILWHAAIPVFTAITGKLPMKAMGQGEDVPAGVGREWARWGRQPDYLYSYAKKKGGLGFATYEGPLRALAISDDAYAPRKSVEALVSFYAKAKAEVVDVRPEDAGVKAVGHFGYFRPQFEATLWKDASGWLKAQLTRP